MKEPKKIQRILDTLIRKLGYSIDSNIHHALGIKLSDSQEYSPLDFFLVCLKEELQKKGLQNDFNQELFTKIYKEAFFIGPIPKNKNHIAIICEGHTDTQNFPAYQLWIDLDKITTTLRQHYQIPSSQALFITPGTAIGISGTQRMGEGKSLYSSVRGALSSNWNPHKKPNSASLLLDIGIIFGSMTSGFMLLIGVLALSSLIAISATGIGLLFAGAAVTAGTAAFCFYQQNKKNKGFEIRNNAKEALQSGSTDDLVPISIETVFKNNVIEKENTLEHSVLASK